MARSTNPSVDEALKAVVAIIESSSDFEIERAYDIFTERYRDTFLDQLNSRSDAWERDHERLFQVAFEHGIIATAIAKLHKQTMVTEALFRRSCDIVQSECGEIVLRGQWCGGRVEHD
jgi:hypothetical protein